MADGSTTIELSRSELREVAGYAVVCARPALAIFERAATEKLVATLDRIRTRGSQRTILKAPDLPEIITACSRLTRAEMPVVTLVTDVPGSQRLASIWMDNRVAGATAAYLMGQWLGDRPGNILVTLSRDFFRGEEEREIHWAIPNAMNSLKRVAATGRCARSGPARRSRSRCCLCAQTCYLPRLGTAPYRPGQARRSRMSSVAGHGDHGRPDGWRGRRADEDCRYGYPRAGARALARTPSGRCAAGGAVEREL